MAHDDIRSRGFKDRTRLTAARSRLQERVGSINRTSEIALRRADGRVLATPVTADRNVPHYTRAAMDGYAVRAEDTFGASHQSPAHLHITEQLDHGTAVRVHTGSELPDGANSVVMVEDVERRDDRLEVFDSVAGGENVGPIGEDVSKGSELYASGSRLGPSDIGLLKSVGREAVTVYDRPRVSVIPTGNELVQSDPKPGEIIETNGLTVTQFVERWGGTPTYRSIVSDDRDHLRSTLADDLDHDMIVTTGGSSVGERDLIPEVVADMGEVFVHGVAVKPGHPVALGHIDETPILMLPGYPVACIVNAVQFLRPAIAWCVGTEPPPFPTVEAELSRKIRSEPGQRTFARVSIQSDESGSLATPVAASGAGVLSSVTQADGWVEVPEPREGYAGGESVSVQLWEAST